ncbi:MAG: FAD-dependent thymidylate synthase [Smithellaceae bacterium]|jgi:flavin-dependent thymidylate synthase|nr:FAD-dependent thymidylate synthase [Smithellaceae bacterium]MDD3258879.1 FAD-dependent thymidylate synthase [Smithellaceae bacterium]MDD3849001.1 FAD-dependent thymidylate synthase [Smithellaceae bacterium]
MMKVLLAGCNVDYDLIRELHEKSGLKQDITPETISAAYARISRSPRSVDQLRVDARAEVEKARRSNRNIVFEMGHSSVAEHAVFNIDVIGVSRLLVEEIEKFRLCSYTEKSQRYVLFDRDFVVPEEIVRAGMREEFVETIRLQNDFYHDLYERLRPHVFEKNPELAANPANRSLLEGWAKEDARYAIALATQTQLGMTVNARNLELMLRRLASLPLAEARLFSEKLYAATREIAPSLIRYTQATDYDRLTRPRLRTMAGILLEKRQVKADREKFTDVRLVSATPGADRQAAAAVLFASSSQSYGRCQRRAARLSPREMKGLFQTVFENMQLYDAALRELENVDLRYELTVSASCFAQLKRHRMATIIAQDYAPRLGVTVPPSVRLVGRQKEFMALMRQTEKRYDRILEKAPQAAAYLLTNAHRRRVLMKFNARELYHLSRLRADAHAQWDIRNLSESMLRQARRLMPLTLMMACGKDGFAALHKKAFPGK